VFDDPIEAEEFVETARRVADLDCIKVLAWCLMGNHYHLVVKTGTTPLWRSMLRFQATVAIGFNRRQRFLGRFWQRHCEGWQPWHPGLTTPAKVDRGGRRVC
jgi:REP element-mobilizing transposase RayT